MTESERIMEQASDVQAFHGIILDIFIEKETLEIS